MRLDECTGSAVATDQLAMVTACLPGLNLAEAYPVPEPPPVTPARARACASPPPQVIVLGKMPADEIERLGLAMPDGEPEADAAAMATVRSALRRSSLKDLIPAGLLRSCLPCWVSRRLLRPGVDYAPRFSPAASPCCVASLRRLAASPRCFALLRRLVYASVPRASLTHASPSRISLSEPQGAAPRGKAGRRRQCGSRCGLAPKLLALPLCFYFPLYL